MAITPDWVVNVNKQIDAIPDCDSLNKFMLQIINSLTKALEQAIANAANALPLTVPPTDLVTAIAWITHFIQNCVKTYNASIAQIAELTAIYGSIAAHLEAKAAQLGCVIPPIPPAPHL